MKEILKLVCGGVFLLLWVMILVSSLNAPTEAQTQLSGETWSCSVDNIGTTLTLCKAAPEPGMRLYITDVIAQSTTATGGQFLLQYGTGTNCGTGTTSLLPSAASAVRLAHPGNGSAPLHLHFVTSLPIPAGKDVCALGVATNTLTLQLVGIVRP